MMDANTNGDSQIPGIEAQLREAIARCGLSQRRLAAAAGVHQPQIVWFMQGKKSLTLWTAGRIADALGLGLSPRKSGGGLEAALRQGIADSGLNCRQLSALSGVDNSQLYRFVSGRRTLTLRWAAHVARALRLQLRPTGRGRGGHTKAVLMLTRTDGYVGSNTSGTTNVWRRQKRNGGPSLWLTGPIP